VNEASLIWYDQLISDLRKYEFEGIVITKWRIGKRICKDFEKFGRPEYGSHKVEDIARDMEVSGTEIYKCIQFAKTYEEQDIQTLSEYSWRHIYRELLVEHREKPDTPPLPEGKYSIIYADPPWEYPQDWEYFGQNVKRHYQTISDDEMKKLPIKDLRAEDCVLYMWATAPKLNVCVEVIEAWGFDYKTCMIWDKVKHNMGFYASIRHEILLIGGYGHSAPEDKSYANSTDSVYVEEKGEHSEKPKYYYEMIERMHPTKTKRIELFARNTTLGWDTWGNEPLS